MFHLLLNLQVSFLQLVLLLCVLANQASTSPNNCTSCDFCEEQYGDYYFEQTSLCKCDSRCNLYGDCGDSSFELNDCKAESENELDLLSGLEFTCRSIYPTATSYPMKEKHFGWCLVVLKAGLLIKLPKHV